MPEAAIESMFQAQCTWDATMAWNAVRALQAESDPSAVMVVLLGSGHVAFGLGAQRQAAAYASLPTATVIPVPLVGYAFTPTVPTGSTYTPQPCRVRAFRSSVR
jgi:hypothetical protein